MTRASKKTSSKPQAAPLSPPPPEPYQDIKALQALHQDALEAMQRIAEEYGAQETPERLLDRAKAILKVPTLDEAQRLNRRVRDAMLVHVLALWARGRIAGKMSDASVERAIKSALSLAKMLDEKGQHEQAESQRLRAERLQADWEAQQDAARDQ
jgi:hypothetical protein